MNNLQRKKILIASDTHGKPENLRNVMASDFYDAMIFCGDGEGDEKSFASMPGCPAEISVVRGNNDFNFGLPFQAVIREGTHGIFVTHGHTMNLYSGLMNLEYAALEKNCDICIFGHTHKPFFLQNGRMVFLNPGSVSEPRQEGGVPTCAVLQFLEDQFEIRLLDAKALTVLKTFSVMNN